MQLRVIHEELYNACLDYKKYTLDDLLQMKIKKH